MTDFSGTVYFFTCTTVFNILEIARKNYGLLMLLEISNWKLFSLYLKPSGMFYFSSNIRT